MIWVVYNICLSPVKTNAIIYYKFFGFRHIAVVFTRHKNRRHGDTRGFLDSICHIKCCASMLRQHFNPFRLAALGTFQNGRSETQFST